MRKTLRMLGLGMVLFAIASLAGCDWLSGLFGAPVQVGDIAWDKDAVEWRDNVGRIYIVDLPAGGVEYEIWGTDIYTDDSPIGTAAVHKGLITFASGGTVAIKILAGQASYTGSLRNGVTSQDYGEWNGSYEFVNDY